MTKDETFRLEALRMANNGLGLTPEKTVEAAEMFYQFLISETE